MKQLVVLAVLFSISLALAGCASVPSGKVPIGNISNLPQTLLNGATLENARSVAMGTARTKGWNIKSAETNRVMLERDLSPTSPQASALGSTLAPPKIEIETDLVERSEGTIVALKAFVITNPGTQDEQRINYTSDYESQLLISLNSLQSAWLEGRSRIASTVPIPSAEDVAEQEVTQVSPNTDITVVEPATAGQPASPEQPPQPTQPALASASAPTAPPPPAQPAPQPTYVAEASPAMPAASAAGLPETATPAVTPAPSPATSPAASPAVDAAPRNDMMVLNSSARKGLWAYYAEDYARLRGCAIGDRGAVLMQEASAFELHEVECIGAANLLVKCQGGVCEGIR